MEIDQVIQKIKTETAKVYEDLSSEMPSSTDPQSIDRVKHIASAASANTTRLAIYLKELSAYRQRREADISLDAINNGLLKTPKEEHLKALKRKELADVYAYEDLCEHLLDICKQRVVLAQSFLKTATSEDVASRGMTLR